MIVGLTGGIGSGKTTVADAFKELGAYVIDWDALSRRVVEPGRAAWEGIVEHFGKDVLKKDGAIEFSTSWSHCGSAHMQGGWSGHGAVSAP